MMSRRRRAVFLVLWLGAAAMLVAAMALMIWYAPDDPVQGPIQKIFYLHLGSAIGTLIAATGVLVGSVGYFWQRDLGWDRLADSSARAAVVLLFVVLVTGMIWAREVWGRWWEWSPPLTFSLILWLLYVTYVVIRRFHTDETRRATVSAAFGLLASLDVPLVYLSVRFLPSTHMSAGERNPEMERTLLVWVVAIALLTVCLIWTRFLLWNRSDAASRVGARTSVGATPAAPAGGRA